MTSFDAHQYSLDRPGQLIAAIPAVLGFVPEQSVVLVTIERGALGCVLRVDLSEDVLDSVDQLAEVAAANRPERAALFIVDAEGASCRMCQESHHELAELAAEALETHGVELVSAHVVDGIAAGGRWYCADGCGSEGLVDDPASSPVAAEAVMGGRRLYASRAELLELITVTDAARVDRVRERIGDLEQGLGRRTDAAARASVEHAMATATRFSTTGVIAEDDIARLACALTNTMVRDTLYALAVCSTSEQAEALWALLARELPAPWRSEALVLLAFSAYARGDGTLAGVSLDAALEVDQGHRMAGMLDRALRSGMRPDQIRELARTGYRLAKKLGVDLPPRRLFDRPAC